MTNEEEKENNVLKEKLEQKNKAIEEAIKQTNLLDERLQKYVSAIPFKEVGDLRDILNKGAEDGIKCISDR